MQEGELRGSGGYPVEKCGPPTLGSAGAGAGDGEMGAVCGLLERQGSGLAWKRRGPNSWISVLSEYHDTSIFSEAAQVQWGKMISLF